MKLSDFDFPLPEELIAQHPLPERDQSRMMVVFRKERRWEHRRFKELPEILDPQHFLVFNTTRVFPARLKASRPGKNERIEVLLVREEAPGEWGALIKPARKAPLDGQLMIGRIKARVTEVRESGSRLLHFGSRENIMALAEELGEPPLPPYIRRNAMADFTEDRSRYQTVYARQSGSVAAPTAGLHFTPEVLERLAARGIEKCDILLHVGYGTFQPVRYENIERHRMEPEYFEVEDDAAARIQSNKAAGRRLIAVGTTTTRVLEYLALRGLSGRGIAAFCDLFIHPGFQFKVLDGLLTNFHLPRSTLFMLVSAFAGRDIMLESYQDAVRHGYRFFSYGDCMLIL